MGNKLLGTSTPTVAFDTSNREVWENISQCWKQLSTAIILSSNTFRMSVLLVSRKYEKKGTCKFFKGKRPPFKAYRHESKMIFELELGGLLRSKRAHVERLRFFSLFELCFYQFFWLRSLYMYFASLFN